MKIEKTKIKSYVNSSISVICREESFFQSPFHSHPELELVYIKESYGKRIIGNSVAPFESGDMVFLGSDIPHVWLNDELYYQDNSKLKAKAIVVYFNKDLFGPAFYELKEAQKINTLFSNGVRGLLIQGKTNKTIAKKLEKLVNKKDFEIIIGLFEILSILSESEELTFINNEVYSPTKEQTKNDRLSDVYIYIKENYKQDISLIEIAQIANLTPTSFCRMFKMKAKKNFVEYLNEIRVANACRFLVETDKSMSDIAYECGYKTSSNFNRLFKKVTGTTPKEYRKTAQN
ncbi:AraC family transcriptional regulator [Flavobacterium sp. TAB 87]|uniref:AraC family transcriptional regulator n=1 Tax=Flavobacterium sp. TAB 87 TaxID=1729581 RepID=UPI00076CB52D|nr:AraC family transcriptional regulator [Flavobacterium sp. TAB 87]KVV16309.1 Methylphosphotriester-DNA--protein-cysteine S-methyltransferase [Flavobacterium sp. TAB 87]